MRICANGSNTNYSENISYSIPCHFNQALLNKMLSSSDIVNKHKNISEIYGCLSNSLVGHGRFPNVVTQIHSLESIKAFRDLAETKGLRFNYLLNAPLESSIDNLGDIESHINDVLTIVRPHVVTASSDIIISLIRKIDANIEICISTIAGIKAPKDLEPYLQYKPKSVIPHHDLGRDLSSLKKLKCFADQYHIELQLLVNESCIYGCSRRKQHYIALAKGENDDEFQFQCNLKKYNNPAGLLEAGWIRPEDITWFADNFGIHKYKISGREKTIDWLPEVVNAYLNGSYDGNLIRLFAITPPWAGNPCEELFLDNQYLQGFIQNLPNESDEQKHIYCEEWAHKMQRSGRLIVDTLHSKKMKSII